MPTAADVARGENAKALADVAKSARSANFFMMDIVVDAAPPLTPGRRRGRQKRRDKRFKMEESC